MNKGTTTTRSYKLAADEERLEIQAFRNVQSIHIFNIGENTCWIDDCIPLPPSANFLIKANEYCTLKTAIQIRFDVPTQAQSKSNNFNKLSIFEIITEWQ